MNDFSLGPHDLVGKTTEDFARILGDRADGFTLFLGGMTRAQSSVPFVRLRVDMALLERLRNGQTYCRENDAEQVLHVYNGSAESRRKVTALPDDPDQRWSLCITAMSFWLKASVKGQTEYDKPEDVFISVAVPTRRLLEYLDVVLATERDPAHVEVGPLFKLTRGPYVLLTGDDDSTQLTDQQFPDVVAAHCPEFQAEVTAAAMRATVAKSLAADTGQAVPAEPAPRRRRMNA